MKIVCKTLISLFLAVILSSCNSGVAAIPTMSQVNIMGTAMSIAKTEVVTTMTAVPTATYPPPTPIPPEPTRISPDSYADKIDYAMVTASKIYTLLPYANKADLYGEYSGCTKTHDFHNFVTYVVMLPMNPVNTAFEKYFQSKKWEFTEATSELVGNDNNIPRTTYDVYRIVSEDISAFERLRVILTDDSAQRGINYTYVRVELTHIETKEYFKYLSGSNGYNFYCNNNESWLWNSLRR